jgi:hypothetical protein
LLVEGAIAAAAAACKRLTDGAECGLEMLWMAELRGMRIGCIEQRIGSTI